MNCRTRLRRVVCSAKLLHTCFLAIVRKSVALSHDSCTLIFTSRAAHFCGPGNLGRHPRCLPASAGMGRLRTQRSVSAETNRTSSAQQLVVVRSLHTLRSQSPLPASGSPPGVDPRKGQHGGNLKSQPGLDSGLTSGRRAKALASQETRWSSCSSTSTGQEEGPDRVHFQTWYPGLGGPRFCVARRTCP